MKINDTGEEIVIYDFNALQAFKIARKLEKEGMRFYEKFIDTAQDPKIKETLFFLLDEEREHLNYFQMMIEREAPEDFENEGDDITDIINTGVFALPHNGELPADLDATLELGATIEKRSLAFYLELLKHTDSDEGKNALRKIIGEEKKHWEELKRLI